MGKIAGAGGFPGGGRGSCVPLLITNDGKKAIIM